MPFSGSEEDQELLRQIRADIRAYYTELEELGYTGEEIQQIMTGANKCASCQMVMKIAHKFLKSAGAKAIKYVLVAACAAVPIIPLKIVCGVLLYSALTLLVEAILSGLPPLKACQLVKLCPKS